MLSSIPLVSGSLQDTEPIWILTLNPAPARDEGPIAPNSMICLSCVCLFTRLVCRITHCATTHVGAYGGLGREVRVVNM